MDNYHKREEKKRNEVIALLKKSGYEIYEEQVEKERVIFLGLNAYNEDITSHESYITTYTFAIKYGVVFEVGNDKNEAEWDTVRLDDAAEHIKKQDAFYRFVKLFYDFLSLKDRFKKLKIDYDLLGSSVDVLFSEFNKRLPCEGRTSAYYIPKFPGITPKVIIWPGSTDEFDKGWLSEFPDVKKFFEFFNCDSKNRKINLKNQMENLKSEYVAEFKQKLKNGVKKAVFSSDFKPVGSKELQVLSDSIRKKHGSLSKEVKEIDDRIVGMNIAFWNKKDEIFDDEAIRSITETILEHVVNHWSNYFNDFYSAICDLFDKYNFSAQELKTLEFANAQKAYMFYFSPKYNDEPNTTELYSIFSWISRILRREKISEAIRKYES